MSSPWKCPHCGTPQAEAARCWACKRSPLACSTCRDFRRSVAGKLGYCGKGKARAVLTGDEVRPCWSAPVTVEEPQLLGLFGSLEAPPAPPTPPAARPRSAPARIAPPPVESPVIAFAVTPDLADDDADRAAPGPEDVAPLRPPVRPAPAPRAPAPTAAVAARRRWDVIVADVAAGAPLGSEPTGGATPSMPYRPAPGSTPIVPWLATAARATDPTRPAAATATATPPLGTPSVAGAEMPAPTADRATEVPPAMDEAAFAAWAASEPASPSPAAPDPGPTATPTPTAPPPTPWSSPIPGASTWAQSTDDLTPSEPIRWRHRAADDPAPTPVADPTGPSGAPRRPTSLSLIPATLANRFRRHLGTRGPRTDVVPAPIAPAVPPAASPLTSPSVRGATPISTTHTAPYGRLVDAPPVTGTIMSLGDQLRRAEQLRRERALLDGERLGGERRLEPPA